MIKNTKMDVNKNMENKNTRSNMNKNNKKIQYVRIRKIENRATWQHNKAQRKKNYEKYKKHQNWKYQNEWRSYFSPWQIKS